MQSLSEDRKTLTIDVSAGKLNYSQRNNQYKHVSKTANGEVVDVKASTTCNFTSIVQSLDYNGFIFPKGKYEQPEDNLTDFAMSSEKVDFYYKTHIPVLYKDYKAKKTHKDPKTGAVVIDYYTPNEVHSVIAYAVNLWLGCEVDTFKENTPIIDIVKEIIEERSCVISGVFNGLNHIVSLVGCQWVFDKPFPTNWTIDKIVEHILQTKTLPTKYIIDDPYGKWNAEKGYNSGLSGNNSELTAKEFMSMIKPVNNNSIKMCHLLKSGAAIV